jgi:hypothetical protein
MTSIAELDHQINPQAIAEILRQELHSLKLEAVTIDAEIVDSNLDLQIRSNSAIDKEKLLTLIHGELQNLQIESLAKFRIHCWRKSEMAEPRLLWSEQFMLHPIEVVPQNLATDADGSRLPEPQLSKNSVLQSAISQISSHNPKMQQHLMELQQDQVSHSDRPDQSLIADQSAETKPSPNFQGRSRNVNLSSTVDLDHSYWHLVLVGLSIVLVGLGIGAVVRTLTTKNVAADTVDTKILPPPMVKQPPAIAAPPTPLTTIAPSSPMPQPELQPISSAVTLSKFNLVENGMTIEQVERIFGVTGKVIAENNSGEAVGKVYSWRNPEGSNAIIEFKNGQVVAKAQAGL